jgi:hypothetical protein
MHYPWDADEPDTEAVLPVYLGNEPAPIGAVPLGLLNGAGVNVEFAASFHLYQS